MFNSFPEPNSHRKIKVGLDLSNDAIICDIKKGTDVYRFECAETADLASLKSDVD